MEKIAFVDGEVDAVVVGTFSEVPFVSPPFCVLLLSSLSDSGIFG